jgi:hypothetical protein
MASPEEFSGTPFVAGSIYGTRSWNVDPIQGLLNSPSSSFKWESGENVAGCTQPHSVDYSWGEVNAAIKNYLPDDVDIRLIKNEREDLDGNYYAGYTPEEYLILKYTLPDGSEFLDKTLFGSGTVRFEDNRWHFHESYGIAHFMEAYGLPREEEIHSLDGCTCGFYAFFNTTSNEYFSEDVVTGIIEGYGEVVIGPRGFRAKKAKIVALYIPEQPYSARLKPSLVPRQGFDDSVIDLIANRYPEAKVYHDYNRMMFNHPVDNLDTLSWDE